MHRNHSAGSLLTLITVLLLGVGCDGLFFDLDGLPAEVEDHDTGPETNQDTGPGTNQDTGPETNQDTGPLECTQPCEDPTNGSAQCVEGSCQITCNSGYQRCGSRCVDLETDNDHCGQCDLSCGAEHCVAGSCQACDPDERPFGAGDGSTAEPYLICSIQQFQRIGEAPESTFELFNDLDFDGATITPIEEFGGRLDGQGHTLSNLNIEEGSQHTGVIEVLTGGRILHLAMENLEMNSTGDHTMGGLVGRATAGSRISDISISEIAMVADQIVTNGLDSERAVGGLVGENAGTVERIQIDGLHLQVSTASAGVDPFRFGGLVGHHLEGTISDSHVSGEIGGIHENVPDIDRAGGLVGLNRGHIQSSGADVELTKRTTVAIGGLVGENLGTIEDSYAIGNVSGTAGVGGLVGAHEGEDEDNGDTAYIHRSFAAGEVRGTDYVGGLIGWMKDYTRAIDTYSTGSVEGNYAVGGLVGEALTTAEIHSSYSSGKVDGGSSAGGFVGRLHTDEILTSHWDVGTSQMSSPFGTTGDNVDLSNVDLLGLTAPDFANTSDPDHFVGWDFSDVWTVGTAPDSEERPIFIWQGDEE